MNDAWARAARRANKDKAKEQIYRDKGESTLVHYTIDNGQRISISRSYAEYRVCSGKADYVDISF